MKRNGTRLTIVCAGAICVANCFASDSLKTGDVPEVNTAPITGTPLPNTEAARSTPDLLSRVKMANEDLYSSLQSFVCNEEMVRFRGSLSGENGKHIDTVSTKVSFENGVEHYTDILQNKKQRSTITALTGAWSEGEFGTLLGQTHTLLNTQPVLFRMFADLNGTAAALYTVEISEQNSPWDLNVESHHYRIPFRTDVWVSRATGEILKLERFSICMPRQAGISEIRWGVTLQPVELNGKHWLLPAKGSYAVLYGNSGKREWNEITFASYHRYGSEVALRFE